MRSLLRGSRFSSTSSGSAGDSLFHYSNQNDYPLLACELLGSVLGFMLLTASLTVIGILASLVLAAVLSPATHVSCHGGFHLRLQRHGLGLSHAAQGDDSFAFLSIYSVGSQMILLTGICLLALFGRWNIPMILLLTCCTQLLVIAASAFTSKAAAGWYPLRINLDLVGKIIWSG